MSDPFVEYALFFLTIHYLFLINKELQNSNNIRANKINKF